MKNSIVAGAVMLVLVTLILFSDSACTQASAGTKRFPLQKHDLSISGREVVQVRVDIDPGITYPAHSHPGEEIVYVVEGLLQYNIEGRNPVIVRAGEVLFIPAGASHSVKNVGTLVASEIATYIVEKGKPLLTLNK